MKIFIYMRSVIKKILLVKKKEKKERRIDQWVKWKLIKGSNILKLKHIFRKEKPLLYKFII